MRLKRRQLGLLLGLALVVAACQSAGEVEPAPGPETTAVETTEPAPEPETPETTEDEAEQPFAGTTVRVLVELGPALGNPIKPFVAEWEEATGATVELVETPFAEIFPQAMTAFQAGADEFDIVIILPTWFGDMAGGGFLEPLDSLIEANADTIQWDDILPRCQEISRWEGQVFQIPLDCDAFISFYNREFIADQENAAAFEDEFGYELAPPTSWEQYLDIAQFASENTDMAGVMESMARGQQTFWNALAHMVGYLSQGGGWELFFDPTDMTPLINSPGHVQGLQDMIDLIPYGTSDILEIGVGEIRSQFPTGAAALATDWASIGFIPPDRENQDLIGFNRLPGATQVYDHESGEWVEVDNPNQVAFMAANGWGAAIPKTSPNKEAAFDLIAFLASPEISLQVVSMRDNFESAVGYQPFRFSHFENVEGWLDSGWNLAQVEEYLEVTRESLTGDFVQPDLRIPGAFEYLDALDAGVTAALAGQMSAQEALDQVATQWDQITDERGRDTQLALYRRSIGLD